MMKMINDINYFITDHLGSTRVITNNIGEIKEQNDYYPFGMRHGNANLMLSANRWGFNGKERQTTANINYMDYGARMYDDFTGRWFVQDPLQEKYYPLSSYNYCFNNPLKFIDPDGKDGQIVIDDINNIINIKANIILYSNQIGVGRDILNKTAENYQKSIIDKWSKDSNGNAWTHQQNGKTYTVNFDINVSVDISAADKNNRNYNGENNYIEVVNGNDQTYRSKVTGSQDGIWAAETQSAAHEFGHLIGLKDRYTNVEKENGRKQSVSNDGWEGNIMSNIKGKVEQKNINAIFNDPFMQKAKNPYSKALGFFIYTRTRKNKE